ncbi:MAG: SprB repeat-containing protein, partial [Bacteroidia bacterium]|nr:SprB repeat-containing protein [Bacteroidia bacterium]
YTRVYNNYISGQQVGVHVKSATSSNNELYFNSFYNTQRNLNFSKPGTNANWKIKNNIFYATSTVANDACVFIKGNSQFAECDYNLYYVPNGARVAIFDGIKYTTLASWKAVDHELTGGNGDGNSIQGNPEYKVPNTGNLDIEHSSACFGAGIDIAGIDKDIYDTQRQSPPSIGACEVTPLAVTYKIVPVSVDSLGSIELNITGGFPPYTILWNDEELPSFEEVVAELNADSSKYN